MLPEVEVEVAEVEGENKKTNSEAMVTVAK